MEKECYLRQFGKKMEITLRWCDSCEHAGSAGFWLVSVLVDKDVSGTQSVY
jgi:hypothetical protein